jgi:glycine/D-amino acid oxidase-like deaminating enzyme
VRHKVYSADYVDNVGSSEAGLETSCVVEGTRGGTILIGASRERVGFDTTLSVPVVETLARQAVAIFPFLARVNLLRVYRGFRPYCPDHLPVIGPDPRVPGVIHACGHEGAGIGLAAGTGRLVSDYVTGSRTPEAAGEWAALLPDRFAGVTEESA